MAAESGGFTSMAGAKAEGSAPEVGVGMIGYAFMGKAHSHAMLNIAHMMYPPPAVPKLVAIAGRNEAAVSEAAKRYGELSVPLYSKNQRFTYCHQLGLCRC